ncbi:ribonuclease P protein component [bacterium]|nr:ribonuclease P protein component [FCB group bacterium]MBL7191952.1 ribonuclease P protein component [bacterium]
MSYPAKLPKKAILNIRGDISRAVKKGKRIQGKYCCMIRVSEGIIRPSKNDETSANLWNHKKLGPKFAVLVKKKCGSAVKRNRMKRIVREFFRNNKELFMGEEAVVFALENRVEDEADFKKELEVLSGKNL